MCFDEVIMAWPHQTSPELYWSLKVIIHPAYAGSSQGIRWPSCPCSFRFCIAPDHLGKLISMRSTHSLETVSNALLWQTLAIFGWLTDAEPISSFQGRSSKAVTPLCSSRSMAWCPWLNPFPEKVCVPPMRFPFKCGLDEWFCSP